MARRTFLGRRRCLPRSRALEGGARDEDGSVPSINWVPFTCAERNCTETVVKAETVAVRRQLRLSCIDPDNIKFPDANSAECQHQMEASAR